jgi:hypothetical protein
MQFKIGDKVLLKKWGIWGKITDIFPMDSKGTPGFKIQYLNQNYLTWTFISLDLADKHLLLDTIPYLKRLRNGI